MRSRNTIILKVPFLACLLDFPDLVVVGRHFSPACYLQDSVPAALYLALKYTDDPSTEIESCCLGV